MKTFIVKVLDFVVVIVALIAAGFISKNIGLESILRGKEEPVTLAIAEEGLMDDSIGMPAGEDIPRIEDMQTWADTWWDISPITIEPVGIIPTGIAARYSWISPYQRSRKYGNRKRPDVTYTALDFFNEYGEYYLLQLPDESYILAQIPIADAWKIKLGKKVTLPIGKKHAANFQVLSRITDLCEEYNINTDEGIFYCINDQWNEEHHMLLFFIQFGVGFVIVLVFGSILITIIHKLFGVKD